MHHFDEPQLVTFLREITIRLGRTKAVAATTCLSIAMSVIGTVLNLYLFGFLHADGVTLVSILIAIFIPFSVALPVSWFVFSMVFSMHKLETEMRQLATYDALTGLLNRRSFFEKANKVCSELLRRQVQFAILILDLDHFKQINDTYGHATGDRVLEIFGKIIHQVSRPGDLAARIGGEEFAFLLPDSTGEQAWHFAERLHQAIRVMTIEEAGGTIRFSASIGLVFCSQIVTIEKALSLADQALYRAKENGRDQSVFYKYTDEHPKHYLPLLDKCDLVF